MALFKKSSEQNTPYQEAQRYLANARETYKKAGKDGDRYTDRKYVRGAANYAYHAVLIALDEWLTRKGIKTDKRKDILWYRNEVGKQNRKTLDLLNDAYDTLHLAGGYDGNLRVKVNQDGLELAEKIINLIAE